jgi:hypothetical protein
METATLFFCRVSDLYLKDDGIIAFVMPRSTLTGALHHVNFKEFKKPQMKLEKILDVEDVSPLFNVPSCVLISAKAKRTSYPVYARRYSGKLPEKNARLTGAVKSLSVRDYLYERPKAPSVHSVYYGAVKAGAAIYPRQFYFVEFDVHPILGIDATKPSVRTSDELQEKESWKGIRLKGNVESNFIYVTLLGGDLVPFGHLKMRPIVLPIEPSLSGYKLYDSENLRSKGFTFASKWFEEVQKWWETRRSKKAEKSFPKFINAVDYQQLLRCQNPKAHYVVVYNSSGTNLVSCVIDKQRLPQLRVAKAEITPARFIADKKTHYYETNNENEAHYVCAILNSSVINDAIKPLQTRGLYGERDIGRRPFLFPIPKYNGGNSKHLQLVEISKKCHTRLESKQFVKKSAAGTRSEARGTVAKEIEEIDELVSELLGL